jgi:hypothetical protein
MKPPFGKVCMTDHGHKARDGERFAGIRGRPAMESAEALGTIFTAAAVGWARLLLPRGPVHAVR